MVFVVNTKREADRIASAVTTMTGYQPSVFKTLGGGYRVQENDYGVYWQEALEALLAEGVRPSACTRERVAQKQEEMGL